MRDRTGRVFDLKAQRNHSGQVGWRHVSKVVCDIGKKAGVKVHTNPISGKVKIASAHDLRRSFGERWSRKVMPQVLMELMRHEDIQTTMKYYVRRSAEATADAVWATEEPATTLGNSRGSSVKKVAKTSYPART